MPKNINYHILNMGLRLGLCLLAASAVAQAQQIAHTSPTPVDLYCSGIFTNQTVPDKFYIISGEDSSYKTTFIQGDAIYINAGAEQGVKLGDLFDAIRPVSDNLAPTPWFKYQAKLTSAMGTRYADIGRLRVVHVNAKTSIVEVDMACDPFQRGDIVYPFVVRPAPQFHNIDLDRFAPPSGKKTAMVVIAKDSMVLDAPGKVIYVNLGNREGVRIGDYFRVFRYQGSYAETGYQIQKTAYKLYWFGGTPRPYMWNDLPRQVIGEGIVLRVGPNSSTVMLTTARQEIYAGDYVEVE